MFFRFQNGDLSFGPERENKVSLSEVAMQPQVWREGRVVV